MRRGRLRVDQGLGSGCTSPSECPGGHCVDGVCCCIAAACPMCKACGASRSCAPAATGTSCTTAHASASACDGRGTCGESQCDPGYLDCDGNPTCERHDVNPEVYLADILIRLQDHPADRVAELLPHRWKETFGSGFTVERVVTPSDAA